MNRSQSAIARSALWVVPLLLLSLALGGLAAASDAQAAAPTPGQHSGGGEASLIVPDLGQVPVGGMNGRSLLMLGLVVCALGLLFGIVIFKQLQGLPVHASMREISELIYETCKTYLITQGKFLLILEAFIGVIIVLYFGALLKFDALKVVIILAFSLIGIGGSYGVAWFGMRINTFAKSRTAFASLEGKPFPVYAIPLKAGMSVGMLLISVELFLMLCILLFIPGDYAGPCFIGFAIGESLGAAALRIAGGIFTKIADIGADLMKIVFNVKEDDARNPGVIHRAERTIATCVRFMRWAPSVERSPQLYATPSMSVNENHPSHDRQVPELTRFAGTRTIRARMNDALVDSHVDRDDARARQRERTVTCPTCGTASVSGSTRRTECLATRADVS